MNFVRLTAGTSSLLSVVIQTRIARPLQSVRCDLSSVTSRVNLPPPGGAARRGRDGAVSGYRRPIWKLDHRANADLVEALSQQEEGRDRLGGPWTFCVRRPFFTESPTRGHYGESR